MKKMAEANQNRTRTNMGATKREVAEQLGVAKQTIVNYIAKLELADHVKRVGKTDILDEFAVSAIADAVGKGIPRADAAKEDGAAAPDTVVAMLNERIADLKTECERLRAELEGERASRAREVESLREQLSESNGKAAELAGRLAGIAERQQVIAATPWWKRGRMAVKLLGPGE